jgi:hypothetical protein
MWCLTPREHSNTIKRLKNTSVSCNTLAELPFYPGNNIEYDDHRTSLSQSIDLHDESDTCRTASLYMMELPFFPRSDIPSTALLYSYPPLITGHYEPQPGPDIAPTDFIITPLTPRPIRFDVISRTATHFLVEYGSLGRHWIPRIPEFDASPQTVWERIQDLWWKYGWHQ